MPTASAPIAPAVEQHVPALKPVLPEVPQNEQLAADATDPTPGGELLAAPPRDLSPSIQLDSDPQTRRLLAWKFSTGDALRYQTDITEKLNMSGQAYENQRHYTFRWNVWNVTADVATLILQVETVLLQLEFPPLVFDSDEGPPFSSADPAAALEAAAAQALLRSQFTLQVRPTGEPIHFSDGEAVAWRFIPADFPLLPPEPVGPNDAWQCAAPAAATDKDRQFITSEFLMAHHVGGRDVVVIKSRLETMPATGGRFAGPYPWRSLTMTSRFDPASGRFLSRIASGTLRTGFITAEPVHGELEIKQQWLPRRGPVER